MRRLLQGLTLLIVLAAVGIGTIAWWGNKWLQQPIGGLQERTTFEVPRGASMRSVAAALQARGLLDQPQVWIVWSRLMRHDSALKAGEYELQPGLTPRGLLALLRSGAGSATQHHLHRRLHVRRRAQCAGRQRRRAQRERQSHGCRHHARARRARRASGRAVLSRYLSVPARHDRPRIAQDRSSTHDRRAAQSLGWARRGPAARELIRGADPRLDRRKGNGTGAGARADRRGIRGAPAPRHAPADRPDRHLRHGSRRTTATSAAPTCSRDTPYNTYTRPGLPPTPIAMPGLESLQAAVQPDVSGALFFVATGEGDGSHYFSKTLAEHNLAVRRYLRELRRRR